MDDLDLIVDLHIDGDRQGPGSREDTLRAVELANLQGKQGLQIADIGCGTGASAMVLAQELDAQITAVDFLPAFLEKLNLAAHNEGLDGKISTCEKSMEALVFEDGSLDGIWSEGAIYNIGFENGVKSWRRFLKPGGILAVSELTWLTQQRPRELEQQWVSAYAEVDTASAKMGILEASGYSPIGYFALSERCWLENYYRPMQARFSDFLSRHDHSDAAKALVEAEKSEISQYERYSAFVSYGFYIARKTDRAV